jgi:hypothetical protein
MSVAAPPDKTWSEIRDFQAIREWHPAIGSCEITREGGDTIRVITTRDGGVLREKLLEHDDAKRRYTYSIVESPLPVSDYRSTIEVRPLTGNGNRSLIVWQGSFDSPDGENAIKIVGGIYEAGLEGLRARLEG